MRLVLTFLFFLSPHSTPTAQRYPPALTSHASLDGTQRCSQIRVYLRGRLNDGCNAHGATLHSCHYHAIHKVQASPIQHVNKRICFYFSSHPSHLKFTSFTFKIFSCVHLNCAHCQILLFH